MRHDPSPREIRRPLCTMSRAATDHDVLRRLAFHASPAHPCSYLPGRSAVTLFADPETEMDMRIYSRLADYGFRRSGPFVYRPACPGCDACTPVRVPVSEFVFRRSLKRVWRRNRDLTVRARPPHFDDAHFALYRAYLAARHPGGGMDDPAPGKYLNFLTASWSDTVFYEFRKRERLLAVAVADRLEQGLSAVYTFFDPAEAARSLGTFAILWEIQEARRLGLPWLYLGYWIEACRKMSYKGRFRPLEMFREGRWTRLE